MNSVVVLTVPKIVQNGIKIDKNESQPFLAVLENFLTVSSSISANDLL